MIDESHQCFAFKYVTNKNVRDLRDDQYLKIHQAVEDGLLEMDIHLDHKGLLSKKSKTPYLDEIKRLYSREIVIVCFKNSDDS